MRLNKILTLLVAFSLSTMAMADIKTVGVLGSKSQNTSKSFQKRANELGGILARQKINIIFSGAGTGLAGAFLTGATRQNGNLTALTTPESFEADCPQNNICQKVNQDFVETNTTRQEQLFAQSDAIIVLPDGIAALNDVSDYLYGMQNGTLPYKPIIFFDMNNFYFRYYQQLQEMVRQNMLNEQIFNLMLFINKPNDILSRAKRLQQQISRMQ